MPKRSVEAKVSKSIVNQLEKEGIKSIDKFRNALLEEQQQPQQQFAAHNDDDTTQSNNNVVGSISDGSNKDNI